jgi:methionyl aminopeptidase
VVLNETASKVRPGVTTKELDTFAENMMTKLGARSAPRFVYKFPGATCISVNDEVAHGIPGSRVIAEGDTVNIDVSAEMDGYFADAAVTVALEPVSRLVKDMAACCKRALANAINAARAGNRINEIGRAVEEEAKRSGFTTIKNLCSHGVGHSLHEFPKEVLNYYDPKDRRLLEEGMTIAVEPFVAEREEEVVEIGDGWTLKTPGRTRAVQYEHTIIVAGSEAVIITQL